VRGVGGGLRRLESLRPAARANGRARRRPPAGEAPPAIWEEEHPGNVCGRAVALTTLSPMRRWGEIRLRLRFWVRRRLPASVRRHKARPLLKLSFIHFAQWAFIRHLPATEGREAESLGATYMLFETNFNGGFDAYIDAFSYVIPRRMTQIFGGCYGFPGPKPSGPFKSYIDRHAFEAAHYYSAYPHATVTMVTSALQVAEHLATFTEQTRGMDAEQFAARWREFITEVQGCL
jgi:hypothetical protein